MFPIHIGILVKDSQQAVLKSMNKNPFNPNCHEAGHFYPPCNFGIGFCQLNLYQKFPIFFGGEN